MKILVPNHFPLEGSGSGIYTQNVARELVRLGHEVAVIAPDTEPIEGFPFEVETILFSETGGDGGRVPFNFPCFTTHPKSNTTFYELDSGQIELYVKAYQDATDRLVERVRPDIIHCQHCWVTPYCASRTGLPYLATAHGTDQMGYKQDERYRPLVDEGIAGATRIIAVSSQVQGDIDSLYALPEGKSTILLNGFSTDIFSPLDVSVSDLVAEFGLPAGTERIISFVGKLTDFKGVDVLIDAAASYEKVLPGVTTVIVGFGQLDGELRERAARHGLERMVFLGHQDQPTVARIYSGASVSVVPSRIEPFGLVAIEAMACGTPVVATDAGGLPDFVHDEVGGLVEMENPEALAARIIEEVRGETKLTKGRHAAEYARAGFSWTGVAGKMVALYEEILGRS